MIFIILIIAFVLRLINLNQSLWLDEAVQAITAQNSLSYIIQEIRGDFHPPLYHFLMHFWVRVFGNSEIALRMPSVLFGVGTVYTIYLIAKKVFPQFHCSLFFIHCSFPDLTALLVATAPFHIYYSQEARMYSMATFFTAGSFYYFLRLLEDDKGNKGNWGKKGFYFLFTLLAVYTDYYAFFALLAQNIYLLVKKKYKFLLIADCLLLIAYLFWLPMLITQVKTGMLATQTLPEWGRLVNLSFLKALPMTFVKFSLGRITIFNKKIYALVILGVLGLLGALGVRVIREIMEKKGNWGRVVALWFGMPLVIAWLISLKIPNYQPFRLLLILPAFYLLIALGLTTVKNRKLFLALTSVVLFLNLSSIFIYYFNPYFYREDWRGVAFFLQEQQNIEVILPSSSSNWPIKYYDPERKIKLTEGTEGVREIREMGEIREIEGSEVYYIRYLVPLFDPNELILAKLHEQGYTKTREISFNQVPVWEYQLIELK